MTMRADRGAPLVDGAREFAVPMEREWEREPVRDQASLCRLATTGTGWVARRCRDLLPELLRLAGDEVTHWARGTSARLDLHAELALSRALAALSPGAPLARMGE